MYYSIRTLPMPIVIYKATHIHKLDGEGGQCTTERTLPRMRTCCAELYSTVILAGKSELIISDPRCDRARSARQCTDLFGLFKERLGICTLSLS